MYQVGGDQKRKHLGRKYELGQGHAGHWEKAMVLARQGSRLDGDIDTRIQNHQQCSRTQRCAARCRSCRGRGTSICPSSTHTRANPGSQQLKTGTISSIPQMSKLWSRQDEIFAPRQGTESGLPFLRRPLHTCPGGLFPGPLPGPTLQDRWPWGWVHPGGSQSPLHSFPHSLGYSPKDLLPYISRLFLSKMSHKMK